jgi:hypothetical protein
MKKTFALLLTIMLCAGMAEAKPKWISLFNGKDLNGWFVRGKATWTVQNGVLVGEGGMGHIYTDVTCRNFEMKGMFRITEQGAKSNSGLYFRCNPPADDPDGFPEGYEAQICHNQDAYTGWLWKPGKPTGKASELLTKDGEWFTYHIKMVGTYMEFRINDRLVLTYNDEDYKTGHFAIQGHNPGMKIEAKKLYYRKIEPAKRRK